MELVRHQGYWLRTGLALAPGIPLWKVAPTRDADGTSLCDFMVLVPRLKSRHACYIRNAQSYMASVLEHYSEVVFANLDMELNVLWVSHRYRSGLMVEIISAIRQGVPEAVLVAHNARA
jgi:hypothetical protein